MVTKKNKPITQTDLLVFGKQLAEQLISQLTVIIKGIVKTEVKNEVRKEVRASEKRVIKTLSYQMEALLQNRGSEWLGVTGLTTVEQHVGLGA